MRISDWSSDVCSSDLRLMLPASGVMRWTIDGVVRQIPNRPLYRTLMGPIDIILKWLAHVDVRQRASASHVGMETRSFDLPLTSWLRPHATRSEEHTSELQSLMRTSYAVFCLKKKKYNIIDINH